MSQSQHFFSIEHSFLVNCQPLAKGAQIPSHNEFEKMIPAPFRLASQINNIEAQALRPLRNLSESTHDLAEFLNLQSQKIDLMMSYILTLGSDNQERLVGTSFGGSSICYLAPESIDVDRLVKLKIFIEENNCAIFCIAKATSCVSKDELYAITLDIVMIDDEDQEQLVRTSLYVQSNQLKARAELRKEKNTNP